MRAIAALRSRIPLPVTLPLFPFEWPVPVAVSVTVPGHQLGNKLVQIRIMPHHQHPVTTRMLSNQRLESSIIRIRSQRRRFDNPPLKPNLRSQQTVPIASTASAGSR